jgi:DNA-binding transcriptional ArsR family regulator
LTLPEYFYYYGNMEKRSVINALASLAQESRLDIFRILVRAGPEGLSAGKISEITGIPPSTMSFHLKELSYADMVHSRQESRFVIYSANFQTMNDLLGFLTEKCCGGNPCTAVNIPVWLTPEISKQKEPV